MAAASVVWPMYGRAQGTRATDAQKPVSELYAGLQGAILLIAAKRQDAIASALSTHDYETNRAAKVEIDQ